MYEKGRELDLDKPEGRLARGLRRKRNIAYLAILAVIALTVIAMDLYGLDPGSFLNRMMLFAVPLIFGTLGEVYAERSGIMNLGVEGIMAIGAVMGVAGAFAFEDAWAGVAVGTLSGALISFAFALIVIRFRGDQIPAGFGLFMVGLGLSGVIGSAYMGKVLPYKFSTAPIPVLSDIPLLGDLFFKHGVLVYLAIALVPVMWFLLYRTRIGLNVRTIGNNPAAADDSVPEAITILTSVHRRLVSLMRRLMVLAATTSPQLTSESNRPAAAL